MTVTEQLAHNIATLHAAPIPPSAIERAKVAILDTIGVTLAGSVHPGAAILRDIILPSAAHGPATVMGSSQRLNTLDAAQLNGMSAHMLDYDDSNSQLHGHPSVAVLPGLLAVAEEVNASGMELLRAYVVGFETAVRMGLGVSRYQYTHGRHPTSTVGIFAGVAAISVLLGLKEGEIATAFGIAASMAAGIKANFGSMVKPLHVGQAARNGLLATRLAHRGFTSGPTAFEHPQGYLAVFDGGPEGFDLDRLLNGWGAPLGLLEYGMKQKRFPCCYACLPPMDGVLDLVERYQLTPGAVRSIDIAVHPIRFPHIDNPDPKTPLAAKFSVHYCAARALLAGGLRIEDFEGDAGIDVATREVMAKVRFSAFAHDNIGGAEVRITTTDGRLLESSIEACIGGSNATALSIETVKAKFIDCAGRALDGERTAALYARVRNLDTLSTVADFTGIVSARIHSPVA